MYIKDVKRKVKTESWSASHLTEDIFIQRGEYITSNGKSSDGKRDPLSTKRSFGFTKSRDNGTSVENFKMAFSFTRILVTFKDHVKMGKARRD